MANTGRSGRVQTSATDDEGRPRLVLLVPTGSVDEAALAAALSGGDVASVLLLPPAGESDEATFQEACARLVPIAQAAGVAALTGGDPRVADRTGADGHFSETPGSGPQAREVVARFSPRRMVSLGGARDRHRAMELGECEPDVLVFGRSDGDTRPEPHPKTLELARWWAEIASVPSIVVAGSTVESIAEAAATGADFVALGRAVFEAAGRQAEQVGKANAILDGTARLPDGR